MSLVNDMLRDLDQRRKESEGPAARVKLTPAGDYPRQERKNWMPVIAFSLVAVAGGLAYIWMQMNDTSTTLQLDRPVSAVQIDLSNLEGVGDEEALPKELPVEVVAAPAVVEANAVVEATTVAEATADPALENALASEDLQQQLNALAALQPAIQTPVPAANITATPITHPREVPNARVTRPVNQSALQSSGTVSSEQVKDLSEPSPEQKDTLLVQEALRLIANNQSTQAYTKLEKHLLDNPYAHQTRETYAKFLMNEGDSASANALVVSGLELAPNHSGFKKVKARLLIAEGDIKGAVELLQSRAPLVSEDLEYHEILASAQLASRDYDGASLSYTGLVQQDQTQGRWWYGFAAAQDALGNMTAARQAYARAIEKPNLSTNLRRRSQDRLTALGQ